MGLFRLQIGWGSCKIKYKSIIRLTGWWKISNFCINRYKDGEKKKDCHPRASLCWFVTLFVEKSFRKGSIYSTQLIKKIMSHIDIERYHHYYLWKARNIKIEMILISKIFTLWTKKSKLYFCLKFCFTWVQNSTWKEMSKLYTKIQKAYWERKRENLRKKEQEKSRIRRVNKS